ncbi:MAG: nucleoside hydrolase [Anaerolineales bacterium]|nr:nucleoside hydrolase [Anaerolineales bacterium]
MEQIIFDCDNTLGLRSKEIDDGLAFYYLLGRPDIKLMGITTTFGNGTIDQVYTQTTKMVTDLGDLDFPVKRGAGKRFEGPTPAAHFLAEMASEYPGKISILATGPLGNLRAAQELDSNFFHNIKQIVCMGGYLHPIQVGRRQVNELNLSADPEAAHLVLNAPCPVTLMNAQICLQAPFTWEDLRKLGFWSRNTRQAVRRWLILHGVFCGIGNFYLWDLLPAVYLSYPEIFNENWISIRSTVEDLEDGTLSPVVVESNAGVNMPALIKDFERFKDILFKAWREAPV